MLIDLDMSLDTSAVKTIVDIEESFVLPHNVKGSAEKEVGAHFCAMRLEDRMADGMNIHWLILSGKNDDFTGRWLLPFRGNISHRISQANDCRELFGSRI